MRFFWEKYYPMAIAAVVTAAFAIYIERLKEIDFQNFLNSGLVVFPILLGFLLTVSTLLHTIRNDAMGLIRSAGYYPHLIGYLNSSIKLSFLASLASLLIPPLKNLIFNFLPFSVSLYPIAKLTYIYLVIHALLCCNRFIHLFLRIISSGYHGSK